MMTVNAVSPFVSPTFLPAKSRTCHVIQGMDLSLSVLTRWKQTGTYEVVVVDSYCKVFDDLARCWITLRFRQVSQQPLDEKMHNPCVRRIIHSSQVCCWHSSSSSQISVEPHTKWQGCKTWNGYTVRQGCHEILAVQLWIARGRVLRAQRFPWLQTPVCVCCTDVCQSLPVQTCHLHMSNTCFGENTGTCRRVLMLNS
jgi:hypothetical protein